MKLNKVKKALSIIEMSIVLIVIGILVVGVISGQGLVNNFKIKAAQKLTLSSPIPSIKGILVWYETSLNDSLEIDHETSEVTKWYDNNPIAEPDKKINAYKTSKELPKYVKNVINGLPVVEFKDSAKNILIDPDNDSLSFLAGHNYTIFVVEQRIVSGALSSDEGMFLDGSDTQTDYNLQFGYGPSSFMAGNQGRNWDVSINFSDALTPRLHILKFNEDTGKHYKMYSKEGDYEEDDSSFIGHYLRSYANPVIGGNSGSTDLGLAEIVVFKRSLKKSEIESVKDYLLQKYQIKI